MSNGILSPASREAHLRRLVDEGCDVLVVGAGVVGAGAALDAAARGLRVGIVEARDIASGTSSRSSKLIHGGLRYLEQLEFGLVQEALRERSLLMNRIAPHLVRPLPFLALLTHRVWERLYVGGGIALYDLLAASGRHRRDVPIHRHLSRAGAREKFPSLREDALVGAIEYFDAQVDDARHVMFLARTAASYGASVVTRAQVTAMVRDGERVTGVVARDLETGREVTINATRTINATGVWSDDTHALAGADAGFRVRVSKGVHVLVPRDRVDGETALTIRTEKSVLFVIPWGNHWILGTTDTDWPGDKAHPAASRADIDYLLEHANRYLQSALTREDIEGVYVGLRPLLEGRAGGTTELSREHAVAVPAPGLVAVAGGKFTTYRVMAADAVDAAVRDMDREVPPSCSDEVPLLGAEGYRVRRNQADTIARDHGLAAEQMVQLLGRYGSLVDELLAPTADDPTLLERLPGAPDHLRAEVLYAVTHEGARHLEDVLTRRTRISINTADRGLEAAIHVAGMIAGPLGWKDGQMERELDLYRARVDAEQRANAAIDDESADALRRSADDVAPVVVDLPGVGG